MTYVNVSTTNTTDTVDEIFKHYFNVEYVSFGAFKRKMCFLLMDLSSATNSKWSVVGSVDNNNVFLTTFRTLRNNKIVSITISNDLTKESNSKIVFRCIDEMFYKDRWTNFPVVGSHVIILKRSGKFEYTKHRYQSRHAIFKLTVTPMPLTLKDRIVLIINSVLSLSGKFKDTNPNVNDDTVTSKLLDYQEVPFIHEV